MVSTEEENIDRIASVIVKEDHQLEVKNEVSISHCVEIEAEEEQNIMHDKSKDELNFVTSDDIKREVEALVERILNQKFTSNNTHHKQNMKVILQSQYINVLHHCSMICHSHTSILQSSIEKQRTATSRTSRKVNSTESPKQQYKNENSWQASIVEAVLIGFIKIWGYKDLLHSLLIHLYITYNQPFQLSSVATDSKLKWWKNQTSFKSLSGINNIDSWNSIVYLWWWSQLRHLLGLAYHKIPMTSFYLCKLF